MNGKNVRRRKRRSISRILHKNYMIGTQTGKKRYSSRLPPITEAPAKVPNLSPDAQLANVEPKNYTTSLHAVSVVPSKDPERTVLTDSVITIGTKFGPYPGRDAVESSHSDWMQYVTGVKIIIEANLIAYVFEGQIYFFCTQKVFPGMELLVWLGNRGTLSRLLQYMTSVARLNDDDKAIFPCQNCNVTYGTHDALIKHWHINHIRLAISLLSEHACCPYCNCTTSRNSLHKHIETHFSQCWPPLEDTRSGGGGNRESESTSCHCNIQFCKYCNYIQQQKRITQTCNSFNSYVDSCKTISKLKSKLQEKLVQSKLIAIAKAEPTESTPEELGETVLPDNFAKMSENEFEETVLPDNFGGMSQNEIEETVLPDNCDEAETDEFSETLPDELINCVKVEIFDYDESEN